MKEVKSPKKPLIFYYGIALLVIVLFNVIVSPLLVKARVTEVDYGTFMSMIEQKKIGGRRHAPGREAALAPALDQADRGRAGENRDAPEQMMMGSWLQPVLSFISKV